MNTPAEIKKAELNRMADVAKMKGVLVECEVNGRIYRVSPDIPASHKPDGAKPKKVLVF